MVWTRCKHVVNTVSLWFQRTFNMLSTCCQNAITTVLTHSKRYRQAVNIMWTNSQKAVNILSTECHYFVNTLSRCCQLVFDMLSTRCQHIVNILSTRFKHTVNILSARQIQVLSKLSRHEITTIACTCLSMSHITVSLYICRTDVIPDLKFTGSVTLTSQSQLTTDTSWGHPLNVLGVNPCWHWNIFN